jgi:predicted RND superfamily exporter protein
MNLRRILPFLAALIIAGLAPGVLNLRLDNSFEVWLPENDPSLLAYQEHTRLFGSDEVVVAAVEIGPGEARSADTLSRLEQAHGLIASIPGVAAVQSLGSVPDFDPDDEFLETETERLDAFFVDEAGSSLKILVTMAARPDLEKLRHGILEQIDAAIATSLPDNRNVALAGTGVVLDALNEATIADSMLFVPLSYAFILALLALLTRSMSCVLAAVVVLAGANLGMFGLMGWLGRPITMITMALPPIVLVVTVCSFLHLYRTAAGLGHTLRPVAYSLLTTAAGFMSLGFADMAVTRDYGLFAAFAILLSLMLTAVCTLGAPRWIGAGRDRRGRVAALLARSAVRKAAAAVVAFIALTAVGLASVPALEVDTHSLGLLDEAHRARLDDQRIEETHGPYLPLEFELAFSEPQSLDSRELARVLHQLGRQVSNRIDGIGPGFSFIDVKYLNELGETYASEFAPLDLDAWVDPSRTRIRITWPVPMGSAAELAQRVDAVMAAAADGLLPNGATLVPTGYLPLYSRLIDQAIHDQVASLLGAFLVVFGMLALWLRDLRLWLLALAANVPPLAMLLGLMAWLGVPLDIATITIAPAMMGLIVDDSMHLLYHLRRYTRAGFGRVRAVMAASVTVGHTLWITSVVLTVGFLTLGLSEVRSIAVNGLLMAATVVLALVTDLVLLPALASRPGRARSDRSTGHVTLNPGSALR